MSTGGASFETILADFKKNLTTEEVQDFQFVTLNDVRKTVLRIQKDQENLKSMMNMTRLESFLEAMNQFGKVIEVFGNANIFVAFVWGPLKFILQVIFHHLPLSMCISLLIFQAVVKHYYFLENARFRKNILTRYNNQAASTWTDSFDSILDAYSQIGEHMPLLEQYQSLFGARPHMIRILTLTYADILKFHKKAVRMFRGKSKG